MASTLFDVVSGALTAIGQLGQGQTPSPEDGAQGLRYANLLLSKATTMRLMLYYVASRVMSLTANQADYTIGQSGSTSFSFPRPVFIESAQVQQVALGPVVPLSMLDKPKWDAIRTKDSVASIPDDIYVEYTYPNLAFHVNPAPRTNVILYAGCWEPLTQFTSLFDPISFPPAYEEWLESNLAMILAPYYDQPVPALLAQRAADAQLAVMKINAQGLGGSLGENQLLTGPNVGQPIPSAPPPVVAGGQ